MIKIEPPIVGRLFMLGGCSRGCVLTAAMVVMNHARNQTAAWVISVPIMIAKAGHVKQTSLNPARGKATSQSTGLEVGDGVSVPYLSELF